MPGGNPEVVVDGETGYLVPPRDAAAFQKNWTTKSYGRWDVLRRVWPKQCVVNSR